MLTLNGALVTILPLCLTGLIMDKQLGECSEQSVEYRVWLHVRSNGPCYPELEGSIVQYPRNSINQFTLVPSR